MDRRCAAYAMNNYQYKARNEAGKEVSGQIEAPDERGAMDALWQKRLMVTSLHLAVPIPSSGRRGGSKPKAQELAVFSRQLATMLKAGIPVYQALKAVARQNSQTSLQPIIEDIAHGVEQGQSLSESLARHPRVFDRIYVGMVHAGEGGGQLAEILGRVAAYREATVRLRKKVRSAMAYPTAVAVIAVCISLFLVLKIIPVFADIYSEFQSKLPAPTLLLVQFSELIRNNLLLGVVLVAVAGFVLFHLKRSTPGELFWDKNKMRFPVLGPIVQKIALSRFTRTFTVLLRSGVPIIQALQTSAASTGNVFMEGIVLQLAQAIEQGNTLEVALREHTIFPPMIVEMVAVGEQTGSVDEMLDQVATYYDQEIETTLNGLTALIEPLLIIFLGVVVGTVVICMFLPIFRMSEAIQF